MECRSENQLDELEMASAEDQLAASLCYDNTVFMQLNCSIQAFESLGITVASQSLHLQRNDQQSEE
jgi:hypothetical protein